MAANATLDLDAREAYERLAPLYDAFTADHDYEHWTTTLERLAREHGLTGDRLLDVGCGTGKSFRPFLRRGWRVTACDISPAMVECAARELAPGDRVRLLVADMRSLERLGAFDLVLCLDDALNYVLDPAEARTALRRMAANLRPGGLLLFDVNTLVAYRELFTASWTADRDEVQFSWRGERAGAVAPGGVFAASIEATDPRGRAVGAASRHLQRHHPPHELRASIADAGLELVAVRGQDRDGRLHQLLDEERHTKAVYLARRTDSTPDPREVRRTRAHS